MNRRDFLQRLGVGAAVIAVSPEMLAEISVSYPHFKIIGPVTDLSGGSAHGDIIFPIWLCNGQFRPWVGDPVVFESGHCGYIYRTEAVRNRWEVTVKGVNPRVRTPDIGAQKGQIVIPISNIHGNYKS